MPTTVRVERLGFTRWQASWQPPSQHRVTWASVEFAVTGYSRAAALRRAHREIRKQLRHVASVETVEVTTR